jgi:PEP-CTERM motif
MRVAGLLLTATSLDVHGAVPNPQKESVVTVKRLAILLALAACLVPTPAWCGPMVDVGTFSWDPDFGFGPTFTVQNLPGSGGDFADVLVLLTLTDASIFSVDLGTVAQGESAQTSVDLSGLQIDFGNLSLTFNSPGTSNPLLGTVTVASLLAEDAVEAIRFAPDAAPVPEPSSVLLVASGMAGWFLSRRRARAESLFRPPPVS